MDFARPVGVVDLLRLGVWNPRFRKSDRKSCVREEMCLAFEGAASTWVRGVGAEMSWLGLADTTARVAFLASRQRTGGFCGFTWPSRDLVELWAVCEVEFGIRDFEALHMFWKFAWHSTERLRQGSGE